MAIALSNLSYISIRYSSVNFISVGAKMPIQYEDGYWMQPKRIESLSEEAKKKCCAHNSFEEHDVTIIGGPLIERCQSYYMSLQQLRLQLLKEPLMVYPLNLRAKGVE